MNDNIPLTMLCPLCKEPMDQFDNGEITWLQCSNCPGEAERLVGGTGFSSEPCKAVTDIIDEPYEYVEE